MTVQELNDEIKFLREKLAEAEKSRIELQWALMRTLHEQDPINEIDFWQQVNTSPLSVQ